MSFPFLLVPVGHNAGADRLILSVHFPRSGANIKLSSEKVKQPASQRAACQSVIKYREMYAIPVLWAARGSESCEGCV